MGGESCLCDALTLSGLGVSAGMALQADDLVNNGGTHSSQSVGLSTALLVSLLYEPEGSRQPARVLQQCS